MVDSPEFFLHSKGKHNPQKELEATIQAFQDKKATAGYLGLHPQCVFVERFRFLKKAGLVETENLTCPDFVEWKKGINAQSIVLIFSSSFPNNPASIFGHTLLRFQQENQNDLLDYAASYAAFTEGETEGVIYAFKGLFGGYKGVFNILPYYIKVNEYSNAESRDLYEYELNLTPEGVDKIVNHLWELYSSAYFDYYFIDENCSYILSSLVELGNMDWNLTDNGNWYYLPADSISLITRNPNAVKKIQYRPSLKKKLVTRLSRMADDESVLFDQILDQEKSVEDVRNIVVLDSLIAYWNYRKMEEKKEFSQHNSAQLRKTLIQRSRIREKSEEIELAQQIENRPELAHKPSRFALGFGSAEGDAIVRLHYKSGLHDLLANSTGMEPFSQIDFLGGSFIYSDQEEAVELSEINWINVTSLQPYTSFDPRVSWKVGWNYDRIEDIDCEDCFKHDVHLGFGGSVFLINPNLLFFLIPGVYAEYSSEFKNSRRMGPSVEWSLIGSIGSHYKFQILQTYRADAYSDLQDDYYVKTSFAQTLFWLTNWELRCISSVFTNHQTPDYKPVFHELQLAVYF